MPPPPPPLGDSPMSELRQLQSKANTKTNESLESTRRMVTYLEESKEAGILTLVAMDDQGEQLDHIEGGMTQINEDMIQAGRNLEGMKKFMGLFVLPWKRDKSFKKDAGIWKVNGDGKSSGTNQPVMESAVPAYGGYIAKITNDEREDEMENNMLQVSMMLSNCKHMAQDIGAEIDAQNGQIERLNQQSASNQIHVEAANVLTGQLLKK